MNKQSRKELLKQEDVFINAASSGIDWVTTHRNQVIAAVVGVFVLIAGVIGAAELMQSRESSASERFMKAMQLLEAEVIPEGGEKKADPAANPPTFASEKERNEAARAAFQAVVDGGGPAGVVELARFMGADLAEKLGDKEGAEKAFTALAGSVERGDALYVLSSERAAYLMENRGDTQGAMTVYERLRSDGFYADYATYHQARIHLAKGEVDKARELFERIKESFPESSVQSEVRQYLAELGPKPGAAAQPGQPEAGAPEQASP